MSPLLALFLLLAGSCEAFSLGTLRMSGAINDSIDKENPKVTRHATVSHTQTA